MLFRDRVLFILFSCNIASIRQKKEFPACQTCHHEVKPERGTKTYCLHCKSIQTVEMRFVFVSEVADSTGSIDVNVYSEEIPVFINISVEQYYKMSQEQRE